MKKIVFALILIFSLALASCDFGCEVCVDSNEDGYCDNCFDVYVPADEGGSSDAGNGDSSDEGNNGASPELSLKIGALEEIITLGDGVFTFTVSEDSVLGSYSVSDVTYKVDGYEIIGNIFLPTEIGTYTVTASLGSEGIASENSVTVAVLPDSASVESKITQALGNTDGVLLGEEFDIGITPSLSSYYSIPGSEGFLEINGEGKLAVVGLRSIATPYVVKDCFGNTVAESGYLVALNQMQVILRSKLYDMGAIESTSSDVPKEKLALIKDLTVGSVNVTEEELLAIKLLSSLEYLSLAGKDLGDLGYISNLPIKTLNLSGIKSVDAKDSGSYLYDAICTLSELETLSIFGSLSHLSRESYDLICERVIEKGIEIEISEGIWLKGEERISKFSECVYFSMAELRALDEDGSNLVELKPAEGYNVAIVVLGLGDANKFAVIKPSGVSKLELYGVEEKTYYTPVLYTGISELNISLYNYVINAYGRDSYGRAAIHSDSASVNIFAESGNVRIEGADSKKVADARTEPTRGIYCGGSRLSIGADSDATLMVKGGMGRLGDNGIADGSDPSLSSSKKNGQDGGDGAVAIYCQKLIYNGGNVSAIGGDGAAGGNGAVGTAENLFAGAYNGGNGGNGGKGASAVSCTDLFGGFVMKSGEGGKGGEGGNPYLVGMKGDKGADAVVTVAEYVIRTKD